jgi:hypothetical protein
MEYRSNQSFLGLPLLHIAVGMRGDGGRRRVVATGWVAVGDVAVGVLASVGGVAIGGFSLGGLSIGAFAIGGLALGLASLGGVAVGLVALGGAALAWHAAIGGLAIANDFAVGGVAHARQVLSPTWPELADLPPLRRAPFRWRDAGLLAIVLAALLALARAVRKRGRD